MSSRDDLSKNAFLRAILPGGLLHGALQFRAPFDAIFVPAQACLTQLQLADILTLPPEDILVDVAVGRVVRTGSTSSSNGQTLTSSSVEADSASTAAALIPHRQAAVRLLLASFLDRHVAHFDALGLAPTFALCNGVRGAISELLDTVTVSDRPGAIQITLHNTPTSSAPMSQRPTITLDTLNIFVVDQSLMDAYDIKRAVAHIAATECASLGATFMAGSTTFASTRLGMTAREPTDGAVDLSDKSNTSNHEGGAVSTLGTFISGLFSRGKDSASEAAADKQTGHRQAGHNSSSADAARSFQEFQRLMQQPHSRHVARAMTAFVEYANGTSSISSGGGPSAAGAAPLHKPVSPKEVRRVLDQLLALAETIPEWKHHSVMALEGFEKYIMIKIFSRTFAFTTDDQARAALLDSRVAALAGLVSEKSFEVPEGLTATAQWSDALSELRAMNQYKCPRDKLTCGINCCRMVVRALSATSAPKTSSSDVAFGGGEGAGAGADSFLPALFLCVAEAKCERFAAHVQFIDRYRHPSFLDNEAGYLLTCLLSAAEFWLNCDASQLNVNPSAFRAALNYPGSPTYSGNDAKSNTRKASFEELDGEPHRDSGPPHSVEQQVIPKSQRHLLDDFFGENPSVTTSTSQPTTTGETHQRQHQHHRDPNVKISSSSASLVAALLALDAADGNIDSLSVQQLRLIAQDRLRIFRQEQNSH